MKVHKISEYGYEEAALGFSLSYNTSIERAKEILPKYAHGIPGESKFLESMVIYMDVQAPRFFWQEGDTYRIATKQSESTMHTIMKRNLTMDDFERKIPDFYLDYLNELIRQYRASREFDIFLQLKNDLPEGFLQRRIWMFSYKTLQNIYVQRKTHKLPQWHIFIETVLGECDHPEFIYK